MKEKIFLITGGLGFIGANFIQYLLQNHPAIKIVNLDKLTYAGDKNNLVNIEKDQRYTFIHGDICDRKQVTDLLKTYQINTIVHFAAESHVDRSISDPENFIKTNVYGTFQLLEAAKDYWFFDKNLDLSSYRFHHISTDEVYGELAKDEKAFTETTSYAPRSPYSASKASADHLVRAYFHTYQLPITISNCSNNYGPHQHQEKFIPTIIRSCILQQNIPVYGMGKNIRDWLYVTDHCSAIETILTNGKVGETYNIGGNTEKSNLEMTYFICEIFDEIIPKNKPHNRLITFVVDRKGHDFRYAIDNSKIMQTLKWSPKYDLKQGMQKTIDYYLTKNLP